MSALVVSLLLQAGSPVPLTTVAEQSGWTKTGRFDEVERLCADFPKRYPGKVKCERFGTTPLGRPMLALVASADGTFTDVLTTAKKRPVVMFQGGIHAGEIDGKDAGFWLLRDVLDGKVAPGALSKVTLLFVPVFNVDGHERFSTNQRPNQRGPEETGWRVTSQNLNLNRDYMKADAPEMVAMLSLMHRYEPVLFADLHVTDGAKFQHDVSLFIEPRRVGPEAMRVWGRTLSSDVLSALTAQGHLPVDFYPAFITEDDPQSGFASGIAPPRFANTYWSTHHRLGVLVETHSWKPYAHRVKTTFDVCTALLEQAAAHGKDWLVTGSQVDQLSSALGGQQVTLAWEPDLTKPEPIEFLGYAYTRTKSEVTGGFWTQYDENTPQTWKLTLRDELLPSITVRAPQAGYVVAAPVAALLGPKLTAHRVKFSVLARPATLEVEGFHLDGALRPTSYEGRQAVVTHGAWSRRSEAFTAGALFIPINQPQAELVLHLFEPLAPDSFAAWGFFNAFLEQKEFLEDYLTEAFAREQLADPAVKAAFELKLKDPVFAASPEARRRFFASRHPSADPRLGLLPVFRVDVSPPASN